MRQALYSVSPSRLELSDRPELAISTQPDRPFPPTGRWQTPSRSGRLESPVPGGEVISHQCTSYPHDHGTGDRLFQNAVDLQNCLWGESLVGHPVEGQPDEDHTQLNVHFVPNAGHLWDIEHMGEVLDALVPRQPSKSVQK